MLLVRLWLKGLALAFRFAFDSKRRMLAFASPSSGCSLNFLCALSVTWCSVHATLFRTEDMLEFRLLMGSGLSEAPIRSPQSCLSSRAAPTHRAVLGGFSDSPSSPSTLARGAVHALRRGRHTLRARPATGVRPTQTLDRQRLLPRRQF